MQIFDELSQFAIIPVIAIDDLESAIPLADALIQGGLPVAEITFRTPAAGEVIKTLHRERPELVLGAGTVISLDNLEAAKAAGARFGVAPGFNPEIVSKAAEMGLPFIPGVTTPSEIEQALKHGARVLKFFPAEASGGIGMLKSLAAPYAHTGVRFMPTGGVTLDNAAAYLANPVVLMAGGTWIAGKDLIAEKKWDTIRDNCRRARELVAKMRQ